MNLNEILDRPYSDLSEEKKKHLFKNWYDLPADTQSAYRSGLSKEGRRSFDFDLYSYGLEH